MKKTGTIRKKKRVASKQFQNIFVDSGPDQTDLTDINTQMLSLFAHESMLHILALRQQAKSLSHLFRKSHSHQYRSFSGLNNRQ